MLIGSCRGLSLSDIALIVVILSCGTIAIRRLNSSLSDRAKPCCNGFCVVVAGLVFLCLRCNLRSYHLGLLLVLNLVTLLGEVATLAGAHEVRVQFLLEEEKLLLFHSLFSCLGLRIEVKVLPLSLDC